MKFSLSLNPPHRNFSESVAATKISTFTCKPTIANFMKRNLSQIEVESEIYMNTCIMRSTIFLMHLN